MSSGYTGAWKKQHGRRTPGQVVLRLNHEGHPRRQAESKVVNFLAWGAIAAGITASIATLLHGLEIYDLSALLQQMQQQATPWVERLLRRLAEMR